MKKEILFIIPSLGLGGGEKSLVNLLSRIDYSQYNVDLFLINKEGLFIEFLNKEVNILDIPKELEIFQMQMHKSIIKFLTKGKISFACGRLLFFLNNKLVKSESKAEQYNWKYLSKAIGKVEKKYDVAIGYLEKTSNYVCVDSIKANKKIGWIHTDYNKLDADSEFDGKYMMKLDYIVTVSEECKEVLTREFKNINSKVVIIENIISPSTIWEMSKEEVYINKQQDEMLIISIGRLSYEKGFDIAIKAGRILKEKGLKFIWYIVGEGSERDALEKLLYENKLQDMFILKGVQSNPYKYLAKADIYVQPSRFEGKSIAMDEAKILNKAIVATNFTTVKDQIRNGVDGLITEINEVSLAKGIQLLIEDNKLRNEIQNNLKAIDINTEKEINKLYDLF